MQQYHHSLNLQETKHSLKDYFPDSPDDLVNLLERLLQYNPAFRPTARECLNLPMFDSVRNLKHEVNAPHQVT